MKTWRTPLDREQSRPPLGEIHIIENRCKGCGLCVEYCPRQVLKMSDSFNQKGYHPPYVAEPPACLACRFCEEVCPEFAIFCLEAKEDTGLTTRGR